jgi:hypothetical protein
MKNGSKLLSLSSVLLFLTLAVFTACKKDTIESIPTKSAQPNVELTADKLGNDVYFQDYLMLYNDIVSKLTFLDKAKSKEDRKRGLDALNRFAMSLSPKADGLSAQELQYIAETMGFYNINEMTETYKELSKRREKVLNRFPTLTKGGNTQNSVLLKEAYDFTQRYLRWMVVHTEENGTFALNKTTWQNYLDNISSNQTDCPPTEWGQSCKNSLCENNEINELKAVYSTCNGVLLEHLTGCGDMNIGNILTAVLHYGNAMDYAKQNFVHDIAQCK